MKYREYRRDRNKAKLKRLERMSLFSSYPSPASRMRTNENGKREYCSKDESHDYVKRLYRGHRSKALKKQYAKSFRRGRNRLTLYKGSGYKKASGDFWWDYC